MRNLSLLRVVFGLMLASVFLGLAAYAQDTENWISYEAVCSDGENVLILLQASEAITEVNIAPSHSQVAWTWLPDENKSRRFWVGAGNEWIDFQAWVGGVRAHHGELYLSDVPECDKAHEQHSQMVECLGLSVADLIVQTGYMPESDVFEVDGEEYRFGDNLSFFVPIEAIWEWHLYIDGLHLLSFEQSESAVCHITAVYPQ